MRISGQGRVSTHRGMFRERGEGLPNKDFLATSHEGNNYIKQKGAKITGNSLLGRSLEGVDQTEGIQETESPTAMVEEGRDFFGSQREGSRKERKSKANGKRRPTSGKEFDLTRNQNRNPKKV